MNIEQAIELFKRVEKGEHISIGFHLHGWIRFLTQGWIRINQNYEGGKFSDFLQALKDEEYNANQR